VKRAGGFTPSAGTFASSLVQLGRQPFFLTGLALYIAGALIWFRVISTENINSSYPVLVGLTFLLVTLGSVVLLKEPLSPLKIFGLALIFAGILVIARS
jgi:multidrug transporter EmrE-like cation transporter